MLGSVVRDLDLNSKIVFVKVRTSENMIEIVANKKNQIMGGTEGKFLSEWWD